MRFQPPRIGITPRAGWTRRSVLAAVGAGALSPRIALAGAPTDRRLVVALLRGGLDGLAAIPAHGDPSYRSARASAALPAPGEPGGIVDLDGTFGLHPALAPIKPLWDARELAIVHAVALPYADRSHFDAQDLLDNGSSKPHALDTGWLNRAIHALTPGPEAVAVGGSVPLLLRGPAEITSLDPRRSLDVGGDWTEQVRALYVGDPLFGPALEEALRVRAQLDAVDPEMAGSKPGLGPGEARRLAESVGKLLAAPDGPRIAAIELNGWDTHVQQGPTLDRQLAGLAEAILALRESLADRWSSTVVLAMTEFGRTVRGNGTGGTDHGVGGMALAFGGAVRGGRVLGEWPGLGPSDLLGSRDLRPTTDLRALGKAMCAFHLGVSESALAREVFPSSDDVAPLEGVFG